MSELIADCLRAKGVRYFHGHHEQEYFFLLDCLDPGSIRPGKLHVHLDRSGASVTVTVTPDRYYPASARDRLAALAGRWPAGLAGVSVGVRPSSDPGLVGVVAASTARPAHVADLTAQVDATVAAAVELFARIRQEISPAARQLRDAG